ncbi:ABC transporter G family member 22 [Sesamum angolense]|uniref:ABC transporter G family member 22 n=1 Tax=Sesamum angolense TaxID=2727404 RepID=A0AAE2BML2_9LAMI|nr:ABC transporter G family member 22 [Sesamum angolense]
MMMMLIYYQDVTPSNERSDCDSSSVMIDQLSGPCTSYQLDYLYVNRNPRVLLTDQQVYYGLAPFQILLHLLFHLLHTLRVQKFIHSKQFGGITAPMENKVAITLSENFAKIDEAGLFENVATDSTSAYYVKNMELAEKEVDVMTRKTLVKMRSFDLNKESQKEKPMRKTKSFSSHLLLNIDELINHVAGSFEGTSAFLSNSHSDDEIRFLSSIYESSLPPESVTDVMTLRNPKSGVSSPTGEEDSDSCSWRKIQIEPPFRIYLKFEDVNHKVKLKGNRNSGVEKSILQGWRVKNSGGTITYNDQLYTKSLKHRIGFVLQDDIAFPHLTVRETLTYSALLRLPNTLSREQKKARAMSVISELGLERCQNTMIGGTFVRGVSGGERKRVCIGNEILLNPSLLFLDEPTSGLDSTTALRIIQMLRHIAQAGKTVVTTIHQPSSRLFSKFDKLILLSNGCSLYFGKASEAMLYFSSIGCSPLTAMTPAEFLIDLANGNIKDKSIPSELEVKFLPGGECFEYKDGGPSPGDVHEYLLGAYELRASNMEKIRIGIPVIITQNKRNVEECGATWSAQFSILFQRGLKERRHEYLSTLRVVQVISTAVIVGLLWWNSDASSTMKVQDQAGLLFFISVFWAFFPVLTAIFTFPQERTMLAKERSVGMYKLSAYLIARNTSDLPLDLLLPIVFLTIIYFMVGLKLTFPAFFLTLLSIFLSIIAAQGLGLAIGAAFMDVKKATTLASVTVMAFMLSGGFFIKKVPPFMSWIRYVSLNYHTYRLLLKIQYSCVGGTSRSEICDSASSRQKGLTTVQLKLEQFWQ